MGAPPRTRLFYRPLLEDIHRTAVAWQNRLPLIQRLPASRLNAALLVLLMAAIFSIGGAVAMYVHAHTNVRKRVTTHATWEIREEGSTRVVYLSFPKFPEFAEEAIVSERLEQYLTADRPATVRVTMVVVYDFDAPTTKGPVLSVDGIELDD